MKSTRFLVIIVIAASLFLSACSGTGLAAAVQAPATLLKSMDTGNGAATPLVSPPVTANPQTHADVSSLQSAYEAVFQLVNPSVVTIEIGSRASAANGLGGRNGQNTPGSQGQIVPVAEGSGFVWDTAGHVVTNNHVVNGADRITVTFSDGSSYAAAWLARIPIPISR